MIGLESKSACGKIILFGEHAAVYGHPALAAGFPDGIVATRVEVTSGPIQLRVDPWELEADDSSQGPVGEGLRRLAQLVPGSKQGLCVELKARIPPGAGLGSSAALCVALVRCLAEVRGIEQTTSQVRDLAHELEKIFHGQPSGLDDTVAAYGGLCLFGRDGLEPGLHGGQRLTDQALRLPYALPSLVVGDTGVKRSTAKMVAGVRTRWEADRTGVEVLFDEIDGCLAEGLDGLAHGRIQALGAAMNRNHALLGELGLCHPANDRLVELARTAGAQGAKLTGAGGGGGVVAVAAGREDEVLSAWKQAGFRGWIVGGQTSWETST